MNKSKTDDSSNEKRPEKPSTRNPTQAESLLNLSEHLELINSNDGNTYASIALGKRVDVVRLRSEQFRAWLRHRYFEAYGAAPGANAIQDAIGNLEGKAHFHAPSLKLHLRTALHEDSIYIDLADQVGTIIQIDSAGFRICEQCPVKFLRPKNIAPLPNPVSDLVDADINDMKRFLNFASDDDFKLIVAWILNALNPSGPYLLLVFNGEQGTAKSTNVRVLRSLCDPNHVPLRSAPRNTDDLIVSASKNHVIALDNISLLSDQLSDDLCRLSTGGGMAKRKLFSDDDEFVLDAVRPVILNGIDDFVLRGDLVSRSVILNLPTIMPTARRRESVLWKEFESVKGALFSALLNAVSHSLRNSGNLVSTSASRMADAWHFITCAEAAFGWDTGSCERAFGGNQLMASQSVLNSSVIFPTIERLARKNWEGTPTALLQKFQEAKVESKFAESRSWPSSAKAATDCVRRLTPALLKTGIEVSHVRESGLNSERIVRFKKV